MSGAREIANARALLDLAEADVAEHGIELAFNAQYDVDRAQVEATLAVAQEIAELRREQRRQWGRPTA